MTPVQRWLLHLSTLLLTMTGGAYAVMKYLMEPADPFSAVSHPLQPWMMSAHVLVAPVAVFAVGLIFRDHIVGKGRGRNGRNERNGRNGPPSRPDRTDLSGRPASTGGPDVPNGHGLSRVKERNGNGKRSAGDGSRGRASGMAATLLLAPLVASGYLLQTVTAEGMRGTLVVSHIVLGLAYAALYAGHLARSQSQSAGSNGRTEGGRGASPRAVPPARRAVG